MDDVAGKVAPHPKHDQQRTSQSAEYRPSDTQLAESHCYLLAAQTANPSTTAISVVAISRVRRRNRQESQGMLAIANGNRISNQYGDLRTQIHLGGSGSMKRNM